MGNRLEKVVYLLGAGFSAPLGLPVMANFLHRSKDMLAEDNQKYAHFASIFDTIDQLHKSKTYYDTDLLNIEDILSILELQGELGGASRAEDFRKYIVDVIEHHTPRPPPGLGGGFDDVVFGGKPLWKLYGAFVAGLLGYECKRIRDTVYQSTEGESGATEVRRAEYSVVTLNYDLVLEIIAALIRDRVEGRRGFLRGTEPPPKGQSVVLAKLHGSADGPIIPPTWNKHLWKEAQIADHWKQAFKVLSSANQIRIIGYSFPTADSLVKYLLRAAVIKAENLKRIDMICLDQDATVQRRFKEFVHFRDARFKSAKVEEYLQLHAGQVEFGANPVRFDRLEAAHTKFFSK